MRRLLSFVLCLLREIGDENAYRRHLRLARLDALRPGVAAVLRRANAS